MRDNNKNPIYSDLVLVGGGHSHVQLVKQFAMLPVKHLRITLVADSGYAPYSGMLPSLLAGSYTFEETHFDLNKICARAGIRFIRARVESIVSDQNKLILEGGRQLHYDLLSLNVGCQPQTPDEADSGMVLPVKPIGLLLERWRNLMTQLDEATEQPRIAVVGAGAAGCEMAMVLQNTLKRRFASARISLIHAGDQLLPGSSRSLRRALGNEMQRMGIDLFLNRRIQSARDGYLVDERGKRQPCDLAVWTTPGRGASWLEESGLATDQHGFVLVDRSLRLLGKDNIFGAGDCIAFPTPLAKSGVHAVRQAKVLGQNLRRSLRNAPLKYYRPQRSQLTLITAGRKYAFASKRFYLGQGFVWWLLKDWIDRQFMSRWQSYPPMSDKRAPAFDSQTVIKAGDFQVNTCGGCGGKVDPQTLRASLDPLGSSLQNDTPTVIASGLNEREDGVITRPLSGERIVESVDMFRCFLSDPQLFARITTLHALSDLYACGALPISAQLILQLEDSPTRIQGRDIEQIVSGCQDELQREGLSITGGHTFLGSELQLGMSVLGTISSDIQPFRKTSARPGDCLVLTKPIGSGASLAAHMHGDLSNLDFEEIVQAMLQSNKVINKIRPLFRLSACTDVTGFGLGGHLLEMCQSPGNELSARLYVDNVLTFSGFEKAIAAGHSGALQDKIKNSLLGQTNVSSINNIPGWLCDPQTSGGLLIGVEESDCEPLLSSLRQEGFSKAACIGQFSQRNEEENTVLKFS